MRFQLSVTPVLILRVQEISVWRTNLARASAGAHPVKKEYPEKCKTEPGKSCYDLAREGCFDSDKIAKDFLLFLLLADI